MSNTTTKFAIALFLVLATSAASFARGGGGPAAAGHSGSAAAGTGGGRATGAAIGTATKCVGRPERDRKCFQGSPATTAEHKRPDDSTVQVRQTVVALILTSGGARRKKQSD